MKRLFLSALALMGLGAMGTDAAAQFSVYKDGKVLFSMQETPEYVDFTYQKPVTGKENGHDWVDLGLESGTLWATCNVGAETPEAYGDYYAWGETETHYSAGGDTKSPTWKDGYTAGYNWSTYKFMDSNVNDWNGCTKYTVTDIQADGIWYDSEGNFIGDGKEEMEDADDVVVTAWGGKWKMPTLAMLNELRNNCYWVWTTSYNGKSVKGYIVYKAKQVADKGVKVYKGESASSDYNVADDVHIFFPAAGCRIDTNLRYVTGTGCYWLRSLYLKNSSKACYLYFVDDDVAWDYEARYFGHTVRAVVPAAK